MLSNHFRLSTLIYRTLLLFGIVLTANQAAVSQQLSPTWGLTTYAPIQGGQMSGVAMDAVGNVYAANLTKSTVIKIAVGTGKITTIAGTGTAGTSNGNGVAINAQLNTPYGLVLDKKGSLLVADTKNSAVRSINLSTGAISTVAGTINSSGTSGDGGPAAQALLKNVSSLAVDNAGNIYLGDYGSYTVRKIDIATGNISLVAGKGSTGNTTTPNAVAAGSPIGQPNSLWVDAGGNLFIGDSSYNVIREVNTQGYMNTVAGTGTAGYAGDGGTAISAQLSNERGIVGDNQGHLYISDEVNHAIRMLDMTKSPATLSTIAGVLGSAGTATLNNAVASTAKITDPLGIMSAPNNDLYFGTYSQFVMKLSLNSSQATTAVGSTSTAKNVYEGSSAAVTPASIAVTPVTPAQFAPGTLSGCTLNNSLAANAICTVPITFAPAVPGLQQAQLAFTDTSGKTSPSGLFGIGIAPQVGFSLATISTVAGDGIAGNSATEVNAPRGGMADAAGNIYFADSGNNVIRRLSSAGALTTIAGTGRAGYAGDGGVATSADLNAPSKVALDAAGDIYIADTGNSVIRFMSAATGVISTIAGGATAVCTTATDAQGDGCPATQAMLSAPQGLAVDPVGHVYVADTGSNTIRFFGVNGTIGVIAGGAKTVCTAAIDTMGNGCPATVATLSRPTAVSIDATGNIYIADTGNDEIRVIPAGMASIAVFAGQQGIATNSGDGGLGTAATLDQPSDVALDAAGDAYIATNGAVRMVSTAGTISTVAGTGVPGSYNGEGGAASNSVIPAPASNLVLDVSANIYIAATTANRLLRVSATKPPSLDMGSASAGSVSAAQAIAILNNGNSTLNLSGLAVSSNFVQQSGDCTATTSLTPGGSCTIGVAFSPSSTAANGKVTGAITLTDNDLNGSAAVQTINLTGTVNHLNVTTASITLSPSTTLVYGTTARITATVTGGISTTGTVRFNVNGASIGTSSVSTGGLASIAMPNLPVGHATISASYLGDNNNGSSSGTVGVTVQPAVLTVTATSALVPWGGTIPPLTYTITGYVNGDAPSVVGGTPAETTTITSNIASGSYPITITQGTLSASNYTFIFVNGTFTVALEPPPDFLLNSTPSTQAVQAGSVALYTLQLTPMYGYTGSPSVSCSGLPNGATCSVSGPFGGAASTTASSWSQVKIQAGSGGSTTASVNTTPIGSSRTMVAFGIPFGCFGLLMFRQNRKWAGRVLGLFLVLTVLSSMTACGGTSAGSTIATGTYQVVVTAADKSANLSHSTTVTLIVQ